MKMKFLLSLLLLPSILLCGNVRIINGEEAQPFKYSFLVSLQSEGYHFCGGTLLNRNFILTAGHCSKDDPEYVTVSVHRHNLTKSDAEEEGLTMKVSRIRRHERYQSGFFYNDIAIWKLAEPVPQNLDVQFVTLDDKSTNLDTNTGLPTTLAGWGRNNPDNRDIPDVLNQAVLPLYDFKACKEAYDKIYPNLLNSNLQICAGYKQGLKSACNGDSGGPLFIEKDSKVYQLGIASYVSSTRCLEQDKPTVFAKVSNYVDWINQNMAELS